ncbi:MAG: hypothetical protein Q9223_005590, partial [Gallowayella weberi]
MSDAVGVTPHTLRERKRRAKITEAFNAMLEAVPETPEDGYQADQIEHCIAWTRTSLEEVRQLEAALLSLQRRGAQPQQPIVPPPRPQPAAPAVQAPSTGQQSGSTGPAAPTPLPPQYTLTDADIADFDYQAAFPSINDL